MTIWTILILLALAIGLYNAYMVWKITKAVFWILTHVMIVSKKQKADADFTSIKEMFGIFEPPENDIDDIIDDLDGE